MIKTIIIEDEAKSRLSLRQKLKEFCPAIDIIAEAEDGIEGIGLIERFQPQLIFLDIEMPRMNGFEMLNAIKEKNFHIVFTTAYDQYAIKAIKFSAFDYLLKPVDIEELKQVVANVAARAKNQVNMQAEQLQHNLTNPQKKLNKLAIPTTEGLLFFKLENIVYLAAKSNYTEIFFDDRSKILASKTLKDFEELLPEDTFFRPHHSYIINLNYIKRYLKGDGGQIEMQTGAYVDVSRGKKEDFLKLL